MFVVQSKRNPGTYYIDKESFQNITANAEQFVENIANDSISETPLIMPSVVMAETKLTANKIVSDVTHNTETPMPMPAVVGK